MESPKAKDGGPSIEALRKVIYDQRDLIEDKEKEKALINKQLHQKDEYIENLRIQLKRTDEEKNKMCDALNRIEANYKVAFRE